VGGASLSINRIFNQTFSSQRSTKVEIGKRKFSALWSTTFLHSLAKSFFFLFWEGVGDFFKVFGNFDFTLTWIVGWLLDIPSRLSILISKV
jgi:hypothetical protein